MHVARWCARARGVAAADRRIVGAAILLCLGLAAPAARAELGYSLTVASDDRFRGASTSDRLPIGTLAISYDDTSGVYGGISATLGPVRGEGVRVRRSVQYIGFAQRLSPQVSLDIGVSNRLYDRRATVEYARRFAQFHAGVIGRRVSSHLFFAPDYDGYGNPATYGQVDALLLDRGHLSITGHVGALRPSRSKRYGRGLEYDWQLGASRRIGTQSSIGLSWVGGGPEPVYARAARRGGSALVLSASRSF